MKIPEMVSMSELRATFGDVLERLKDGPVLILRHGKGVAVLMSIEQAEELTDERPD